MRNILSRTVQLLPFIALLFSLPLNATALESFPLADVRILSGPFKQAEQNNLDYLLSLDPDRLLAPYRREAGIESGVESYGNWESSGLDGHIGGHYVSALSLMYASTGNRQVLARLTYMIDELKKCQDRHAGGVMKGYLGGVPDSETIWKEIAQGKINADNFALNDRWVPWYNLHKTYAGLRDAYVHAGNARAKAMLVKLTDWAQNLTANLGDEQMQLMLRAEHGGMNEIFADVAAITGEQKYLQLAYRFSDRRILNPLLEQRDDLTGLHANTQIPKVVGFQRIAELETSTPQSHDWNNAAEFFWQTVVDKRTVAIGGNSVREHFNPPDNFKTLINEPEGPETCNTYNMLRLSKMLYAGSGDLKYIDYYERALYNHILSTQHPEHGGLVYFTPMRPQHYRVYSHPQKAMWCCVGSGIENHGKYGELIYAHADAEGESPAALYVNLFIPSKLNWRNQGIRLVQETLFPDQDSTLIRFESVDKYSNRFALKLRYPRWVKAGELKVAVNGKPLKFKARPGNYVTVERAWKTGDTVSLTMPMHTQLEQLRDRSNYYAVLHGPIVLAAKTRPFPNENLEYISDGSRMGHVADGALCPLETSPVLVGNPDEFLDKIKPAPGKPLTFIAPELIDAPAPLSPKEIELIPFFRLHDSRYTIYWPATNKQGLPALRNAAAEAEKARMALEAITIDKVAPGEQQPETEHDFQGEDTESGIHRGRHWRHARGWFSYTLKDENNEAAILQVTYFGGDAGRSFDIFIDDTKLASVTTDGKHGPEFYTVDYPIPASIVENARDRSLTVRFVARKDSIAGGVYDVRFLKKSDD